MAKIPKIVAAHIEGLETRLALAWPGAPEPTPLTIAEIGRDALVTMPANRADCRSEQKVFVGWSFSRVTGVPHRQWGTSSARFGSLIVRDGEFIWGAGSRGLTDREYAERPMFRTFNEARLAGRWALCRQYATALRRLDVSKEDA